MAYQIAFDLYESATQHFITIVTETLNTLLPQKEKSVPASATDGDVETTTPKEGEAKKEESKEENEDAEK